MIFDPMYFVFVAPAILLAMWAQYRLKSTFAEAQQMPAPLSGAAAARHVLDSAGLYNVGIEPVPGELSDHYDPTHKVLRLSQSVYSENSLAAVGVAAHEAGHAIQDAKRYAPLVVRNLAVPLASFGSSISWILLMLGMVMQAPNLMLLGIILFGGVVFFQIINLPVEFDASARAKVELVNLGIIQPNQRVYVDKMLNAAALTYVAATLQSVLILLYYIMRFAGARNRE
jgi:Zn-dependent membrane protease YugP